MFRLNHAVVLTALTCGIWLTSAPASAGMYSTYSYSTSHGYGYRTYTYYSATYRSYHSHYAVYLPHQPRYVYYYNTHSRKYWGRYDVQTGKYQLLADADKKATIAAIPESDFGKPGEMPPAEPGSDDTLPPPEPAPKAIPNGNCHR